MVGGAGGGCEGRVKVGHGLVSDMLRERERERRGLGYIELGSNRVMVMWSIGED